MSNLIGRVQNILLTPKTEWAVIAAEPETISGLYKNYVFILAAIVPVATFLGAYFFLGLFGFAMGPAFVGLVVQYVLTLGGVFLFALVINGLASAFGGQRDQMQALKLAAYALTPIFLSGIGQLVPLLWRLIAIAGLANFIYLLYLGLPHTMKTAPGKTMAYTAVAVVVALVIGSISTAITFRAMGRAF